MRPYGGGLWGALNTATPQKNLTNTASPQKNLTKHRHRNIFFISRVAFSLEVLKISFPLLPIIRSNNGAQRVCLSTDVSFLLSCLFALKFSRTSAEHSFPSLHAFAVINCHNAFIFVCALDDLLRKWKVCEQLRVSHTALTPANTFFPEYFWYTALIQGESRRKEINYCVGTLETFT